MRRIQHATAAGSLPDYSSTGSQGYFTEGNAGSGIPATRVTADFLNGVQEELVNVIVSGGLTPDGSDRGQLLKALKAIFRPVGMGYWFTGASSAVPAGYIIADGSEISRATYSDLWAFANSSGNLAANPTDKTNNPGKYGSGNGTTTFTLPNVVGDFLRVAGGGRTVGTHQADAFKDHTHGLTLPNGTDFATGNFLQPNDSGIGHSYVGTTDNVTGGAGTETRPVNTAFLFIISY